ncbi:hypothetical protein ACFC3O_29135 [Streptomyces sp. NPDC056007]|uniref:hypothetical protein n=1 Tax=Streptomyces sp. NPDC056007 TaxID=3345678 RepID=UPI0035D73467
MPARGLGNRRRRRTGGAVLIGRGDGVEQGLHTAQKRTPPSVEDVKEGRIQTVLSGRSLIGLLIKLWDTRHTTTLLEADWALATTAYNRIATDLTGVDGQGQTIRIVLDDGLPHTDND